MCAGRSGKRASGITPRLSVACLHLLSVAIPTAGEPVATLDKNRVMVAMQTAGNPLATLLLVVRGVTTGNSRVGEYRMS